MTSQTAGMMDVEGDSEKYVTVTVAGQLFGLPISKVQDVFVIDNLTQVPLAIPEVVGVLNLRGRIMTAICMRKRMRLPERDGDRPTMAAGIEYKGESYGLLIDEVGDVLSLSRDTLERNPINLDPRWASVSAGVHRLENELLVILDVEKVLDIEKTPAAA